MVWLKKHISQTYLSNMPDMGRYLSNVGNGCFQRSARKDDLIEVRRAVHCRNNPEKNKETFFPRMFKNEDRTEFLWRRRKRDRNCLWWDLPGRFWEAKSFILWARFKAFNSQKLLTLYKWLFVRKLESRQEPSGKSKLSVALT